jgi:hypothetical protein
VITLTSVEPLFREDAPVPKDTMKKQVLEDFKLHNLIGVADQKLQINFNPDDGSDIIVKLIDPHAASGYLVFQDEKAYKDWLDVQLFDPSQDEIEEAARGKRSS